MDAQIRKRIVEFYRERYCVISVDRVERNMMGDETLVKCSGTLIEDGIVLTCAHILAGEKTKTAIEMPSQQKAIIDPKLLYADIELDIAIFQVPKVWRAEKLPVAKEVKYADTCVSLFPALGIKMMTGIGRVVGQFTLSGEGHRTKTMAMWDMTTGSGSSGSMVVRVHDGQAVGMIQVGMNIYHNRGDNVMLPAGISADVLNKLF